jgi:L-asparaginase
MEFAIWNQKTMKLIIHGGFFRIFYQSWDKNSQTRALELIVKESYDYLKTHSALKVVLSVNAGRQWIV